MRRKYNFFDDDCFSDRDSDYSDYDVNLDELAGSLDFSLDTDGLDFAIDPDSYDFSLDGLNDFD